MSNDRLSPLDASFLHLEDPSQHMHVAAAMIFQGSPPGYERLLAHINDRLHLVPRFRQRLAHVPLAQARPKWVDDPHFDLRYHVRNTALPAPGSETELQVLAGRVFSQQLRRDRPLWELWLVAGLEDDRFAILSKTHHALVDGVSGMDILSVLFAPDSEEETRPWQPAPEPTRAQLLSEALIERTTSVASLTRPVRALVRGPRRALSRAAETAVGAGAMAWAGIRPVPSTPYNAQTVGPDRRFTWTRASLDDVKAIKNALGGTVNDVVLTVVTLGLRAHLERRGEDVSDLELRAFVPVSIRDEGAGGTGNQVSGMLATLPVSTADPAMCLAKISDQLRGVKESGQAVGAQALTELSGFAPPGLMHQASRLVSRQRFVNRVVTNIPGPQFPLYLEGREMTDMFPMVPLGSNLNLGVAIVSYNGRLNFGLVGEFNALHDLDDLADDFLAGLQRLAEAAAPAAS
ncbi:MAG TPA: wax ester/triacylglycerol synthase family O-acyltransferase [Solirubrobacteraceae bacterium]|jgi:WS/DGAT/MGAT family acyltransferase